MRCSTPAGSTSEPPATRGCFLVDISFQDLGFTGFTLSLHQDADKTADSLLSFAYDVRGFHLGEFFLAKRKYRRDMVALELQKHAIREARSRVSEDYSTLAEVKDILRKNNFTDDVKQYVKYREAPGDSDQRPNLPMSHSSTYTAYLRYALWLPYCLVLTMRRRHSQGPCCIPPSGDTCLNIP
jgi:hypothetical protein